VKQTRGLAAVLAATLAVGLGGCISVFPKATPAQLYSFGADFPPQQAANAGAEPFNVLRSATAFTRAATGDRILTTDGQTAAYIAGSRWVSPAVILFDEAETRAFEADNGPARLMRRGETSDAAAELRLEVQNFEANYPGDLKAAPTVVVQVHAVLIATADRHIIDEKTFEARKSTDDNRVSAIVRSFNGATVDVLSQIAAWTDAEAGVVAVAKP
jgi:cholesterol transport system auxiliary component